jgi:hypothetical protein
MDLIKSLGLQLDHPKQPQANFKTTLSDCISHPQRAICPVLSRSKHPPPHTTNSLTLISFMTRKFWSCVLLTLTFRPSAFSVVPVSRFSSSALSTSMFVVDECALLSMPHYDDFMIHDSGRGAPPCHLITLKGTAYLCSTRAWMSLASSSRVMCGLWYRPESCTRIQ